MIKPLINPKIFINHGNIMLAELKDK